MDHPGIMQPRLELATLYSIAKQRALHKYPSLFTFMSTKQYCVLEALASSKLVAVKLMKLTPSSQAASYILHVECAFASCKCTL